MTRLIFTKPKTVNVKKVLKEQVKIMRNFVEIQSGNNCTFWACRGTPENNRVENMITCSRCQAIIYTNRQIKKIEKLMTTL